MKFLPKNSFTNKLQIYHILFFKTLSGQDIQKINTQNYATINKFQLILIYLLKISLVLIFF